MYACPTQIVARREMGEADIPGSADFMVQVLYLACSRAQPEGGKARDKLTEIVEG